MVENASREERGEGVQDSIFIKLLNILCIEFPEFERA